MNNFKKIFVSIKSQIDSIADDFENHEALATAAINDLQQLAVTTRKHEFRVLNLIAQYQRQIAELEQQQTLWTERALKVRDQDQQKALQCMKRLRDVNQQLEQLNRQLEASQLQADSIQNDLRSIEEQILDLKSKKEELAARQHRSHLQQSMKGANTSAIDVQSVFDRWEGSVVGDEYQSEHEIDTLANSFERQDDQMELLMMLEELEADKQTKANDTGEQS